VRYRLTITVTKTITERSQLVSVTFSDTNIALAYINIHIGLSSLAIGGIAANWGFRPPNLPFKHKQSQHPLVFTAVYTVSLGTTRVSLPNGISLRPTALAGCTSDARYEGSR